MKRTDGGDLTKHPVQAPSLLFRLVTAASCLEELKKIAFINIYKLIVCINQTFSDVQVEEIAVEHRLNNSSHDGDEVVVVLSPVAVDPVEQVETSVHAKGKEVVGGDAFRLSSLGHHEQLREDGNRLKIDRESPKDLQNYDILDL
jgi:hypothetical protein